MADIIVTTPKSEMEASAREAAECVRNGGGEYFRRFGVKPAVQPGDRVYYVEDGWIRGFGVVSRCERKGVTRCATTGRTWYPGWYVFMDAASWRWIRSIPMKGFQGFRYARGYVFTHEERRYQGYNPAAPAAVVVGGWRDAKPETPKGVD